MRLSEVLGSVVYGADGRRLGWVSDARFVQDGPVLLPGGRAALRLDGLIVARGLASRLLGYEHRPVERPWLLRLLARRLLHGRTWFVGWRQVDRCVPGRIDLKVDVDQVPKVTEMSG